jgi:hypothetical protein
MKGRHFRAKLVLLVTCLLPVTVLLCFGGCGLAGSWEYKEVSRIKSPDSLVDAVVVTGDAGATTSTTTILFIVPAGAKIDLKKLPDGGQVFVADHIKNLSVMWKQAQLLKIQYDEARIFKFSNVWMNKEVRNYQYVVEAQLAPTSTEFSLPWNDRVRQ